MRCTGSRLRTWFPAEQPILAVGKNQFVYIRSEDAYAAATRQRTFDGPQRLTSLQRRQVWLPQDLSRAGLIRTDGQDTFLSGDVEFLDHTARW